MRVLAPLSLVATTALAQTQTFQNPPVIQSANGVLDTTISMEYATLTHGDNVITTRLLNGIQPGPTLRLEAGDRLKVFFENNLEEQATRVVQHNAYQTPDTSNLHFHGPYISGSLPSDDVTMGLHAGETYQYDTMFPAEHLPGTHWIHPHYHGSTSLQVSGGAAATLIVNDPVGFLPDQIANADEYIMLIQHFDLGNTANIAAQSGDQHFDFTGADAEFLTNSGVVNPTIVVASGEWIRARVVYAGWMAGAMDMEIDLASGAGSCEMQLLAKDGIYLADFPREITTARLPPGGRADIMIRCTGNGATFQMTGVGGLNAGMIAVNQNTENSVDMQAWAPAYPEYLNDLRGETVTAGCNCQTRLNDCDCTGSCITALASGPQRRKRDTSSLMSLANLGGRARRQAGGGKGGPGGGGGGGGAAPTFCISGRPMEADLEPLHLTHVGAIVERTLTGTGAHPYHQHTFPFQLQSGVAGDNEYFRVGDWHDVYLNTQGGGAPVMRFHPEKYTGKMMFHCHRLDHEDRGMMGLEWVHGGSCVCDSVFADYIHTDIVGNDLPEDEESGSGGESTTEEATTEEATTEEATTEESTTEEATTEETTTEEATTEEATTEATTEEATTESTTEEATTETTTEEDSTTEDSTTEVSTTESNSDSAYDANRFVGGLSDEELAKFGCRDYDYIIYEADGSDQGVKCSMTVGNAGNRKKRQAATFQITANGIPDHNAHNGQTPGALSEQSKTYTIPTNPVPHVDSNHQEDSTYQLGAGAIGVALNGVPFYAWFSAGCCDVGFGEIEEVDDCNAHAGPTGEYHYHLWPRCLDACESGIESEILGVSTDGFAIYGPIDSDGTELTPADLDECNGKFHDLEDGSQVYRYHVTTDFPYTIGCFRAAPLVAPMGQGGCHADCLQEPCANLNVWSYNANTMEAWCEGATQGLGGGGGGAPPGDGGMMGGGGGGGGKGRKRRSVKTSYKGVSNNEFVWNTSKRTRRGIVMECNSVINGCDNVPANAQVEVQNCVNQIWDQLDDESEESGSGGESTTEEMTTEEATTQEETTEEATTEEATTEEATTEEATTEEATTEEETTTEEATTVEATTEEATTEEATTEEATTEAATTTASDCVRSFTDTPIQSDETIRMLDPSRAGFCVFKKYADFVVGDEIWYKPCEAGHSNANRAGKYKWALTASGQIQSVGARDLKERDLCWKLSSLARFGKQRVKLAVCDESDINQQFTIIDGRLHLTGEPRLCLGQEEFNVDANLGIALTSQDCYPTTYGDGACSSSLVEVDDQSIRPFADQNNQCLFKKYSGYNVNDEIWVKSCDAGNANVNKAGKYWFSFDESTGLIASEGSRNKDPENVMCMTINSNDRYYKQRVRLALCNAEDVLQQFDFVDGKLYSRGNARLCAGYEYHVWAAASMDVGSPFVFTTCYPNAFAIDLNSIQ